MAGARLEHGTVTPIAARIAAMTTGSVVLIASGIVCLIVSGFMMYRMIPRADRPASPWMQTESGETAMALGQFTLMIVGLALLAKGIL
jgi:hypothetical protein